MSDTSHPITYAKDYKNPAFLVTTVTLNVELFSDKALTTSVTAYHRNPAAQDRVESLFLHGSELKLISVELEGKCLLESDYQLTQEGLTLHHVPDSFELKIKTEAQPHLNKSLEGLYKSGDLFCTQCESEGFRKITYFLDRPDVMAKYTTTVEADKKKYPVLLSNGNPVDSGDLAEGRHFVRFEDPFPKPSYLFALVAGDLVSIQDQFTTMSGREVALQICVERGNEDKCEHAMASLKHSMKWDEDTFGLECDLNSYKVVAVNDFNFGAMENKGLNIFNSQYVLADPKTATDANYQAIEGVIGHEYFHNWTGNRVTCRDWFQITLKEGLTVFRDQEFSSDRGERAVCRIGDVRILRDFQFVEDAGPNAHAIRPESYMEINNFYTVTVYNKGAEVIRMIHTLLGKEKFRKGMDKYFELYDGQAVTTDEFVHAMEEASGKDLGLFRRWYSQAGTPEVFVTMDYDEKAKSATLHVQQKKPRKFNHENYEPFYFPLTVGLINESGNSVPMKLKGISQKKVTTTALLEISDWKNSFTFTDIDSKPVPSVLRNFSAPVRLTYNYSQRDLIFLFMHDEDLFNRYDAGQRLANQCLESLIHARQMGQQGLFVDPEIVEAYGALLSDTSVNDAFKAEALVLPSLTSLVELMDKCDFESAYEARNNLLQIIAVEHEPSLLQHYKELHQVEGYEITNEAIGRRSFKNTALAYLMQLEKPEYVDLTWQQFTHADNMTDEITALSLLCHTDGSEREKALHSFHEKWKSNPLVMNKWLVAQAASRRNDTLTRVKELESHPAFDCKNPNKIRALFGTFSQNLIQFHAVSGEAYEFIAGKILEIDDFNPSAASYLAGAYKKFAQLDDVRKKMMEKSLNRILSKKGLSAHTYEIVTKTIESSRKSPSVSTH